MSNSNHLTKIAIVGAGGQIGKVLTDHLLKSGKFHITAITRQDSKNAIPEGVNAAKVDYDNEESLVQALKGQDVLVITMAVTAEPGTQNKLVDAAAKAGVEWILPNEYGAPSWKESGKDTFLGPAHAAVCNHIEEKGLKWIGVACGFWYEFSLSGSPTRYGFDFDKKTVTFYDDGNTRIHTSTWPQVGRAVAAILSLPVTSSDGSKPSLSGYKNSYVCIYSYYASQKDMFASVLKVSGDKESDWTISYQPSNERFEQGRKMLGGPNSMDGFATLLYARVMYPDGSGTFDDLQNEKLGLPKEDFDESTKLAIQMAKDDTVANHYKK